MEILISPVHHFLAWQNLVVPPMTFSKPSPPLFEGLGAWEGPAGGLPEAGCEHAYSPLGLLSPTALEYELLPPVPLNFQLWVQEGLSFQTHITSSPVAEAARPLFLSLLTQTPSIFMLAICKEEGRERDGVSMILSVPVQEKAILRKNQKAKLKNTSPRKSNSLQI